MRGSRIIIALGVVCAVAKLFLILLPNEQLANTLISLADLTLSLLVAAAAWRAARRSLLFARILWLCISFVALLWVSDFAVEVALLGSGSLKGIVNAPVPAMSIASFTLGAAFIFPLLLREEGGKLKIGWQETLEIAQLAIIALAVFLVFFFIPFVHAPGDNERVRYIVLLHLARDGFLALLYLYRGWNCRLSDLRWLHLRVSAFLAAYGLAPVLIAHMVNVGHWPEGLGAFFGDLPALFLLGTAASWRPQQSVLRPEQRPDEQNSMLSTRVLAVAMPISVVALASRIPSPYLRGAWIMVTVSFALFAARLLLMERSVQDTEATFAKVFRSSPAAMTIARLSDGKVIDANDRALELTKLTKEQGIGRTSLELGLFEHPEEREKLLQLLRKRGSIRGVPVDLHVAGRTMNALASAELIELRGEPLIVASVLDVTELNKLTQQIQQTQKMELIGSLAGGVAHDFNNLLAVITGHAALALATNPDEEMAEHISQIKEAAAKSAGLTQQLLAFSRRQALQPRNISLNTVVASIEKLLRRTITPKIKLVTSYTTESTTVYADPVQMEQVVMNLAVNARDAMPQGGTLCLETRTLDLKSLYAENGAEVPAGLYVTLIVSDTGIGIRPEDMDRLFEPFYTTKADGRGTGLGLSTVEGIVKQGGGHIWACSDVNIGTVFKVCLPRVDSPPDTIQTAEAELKCLTGRETVLVVDDDQRVCALTADILGGHGYRAMTANSAEEAEQRAREFQGEIDLLITDIAMPPTTGWELAQKLEEQRPALKTLYISGYPRIRSASIGSASPGPLLCKPFAPLQLLRQARTVLEGC